MLAVEINCFTYQWVASRTFGAWAIIGAFWSVFFPGPVTVGVQPAGMGREQPLDAVSKLLGNKGGIHARHCAHCRISHAAVVWQTLMNLKAVA
jgi:hypothetical protein